MKRNTLAALTGVLLSGLSIPQLMAQGFTEADVLFYGEVRQVGGAHTVLLQAGRLDMTFVNPGDTANTVTLTTELRPTGNSSDKPYSYTLRVPLSYLPHPEQKDSFLSIGQQRVSFRISAIRIDGAPATLADGSQEFFPVSFASRGSQYRLDLLTTGNRTDSDGDGLPDWWETLHRLDPYTAGAGQDSDGDGWSDLEEYRRGSDPNADNRKPLLASTDALVSESGEAGLVFQFLDSDTPADQLRVTIAVAADTGFEIKLDGTPVVPGTVLDIMLSDLQAGRVTVRHRVRERSSLELPVTWDDGSTGGSAIVMLSVALPSAEDGSDAGLWLDGNTLTGEGTTIGRWPDRSGCGRSATQPVSDQSPVVVGEYGQQSAYFGAPGAHLFFQEAALAGSNQTVLVAYRGANESDDPQTVFACNRGFLQLAPTTQAISYPGAPIYQLDGLAVKGYASVLGATAISTFRRQGRLLQNMYGLSYDGETATGGDLDPVLPTLGARRLAVADVDNAIRDRFQGRLHELFVFPRALEEQKLRDVHDYLQSKWAGAVIWDLSTVLRAVTLSVNGPDKHIVRGGWGDDHLGGASLDDVLSGGPGADTLTGGDGADRFVFGGVDSGNDVITDYESDRDTIDLSALYWGLAGDARQYIAVRLDTDYSTPVPTLNSVLLVQHPGGGSQEITLRNVVLGSAQIHQLIVEGRILMGGLSIPTLVQLALVPGSADPDALGESVDDRLTFSVTRDGDGVAGAMEVPLGLFEQALGSSLILDGATFKAGQRAVVSFAPGEVSRTLTFRPVPDLETQGRKAWEIALLPHHLYAIGGESVHGAITDVPRVWLGVIETNALATSGQAARIRLFRDGDLSASLSLDLWLGGTAREGVHIEPVPRQAVIPAGVTYVDVIVSPRAGWRAEQARVIHVAIAASGRYQLGNPSDAVLYAGDTEDDAKGAGFERWLAAATQGTVTSYRELVAIKGQQGVETYIRAYATGMASPEAGPAARLRLRMLDGRPHLSVPVGPRAADLAWAICASDDLDTWVDAGPVFTETLTASRLEFLGSAAESRHAQRFYRLVYDVDLRPSLSAGVAALTGASRLGMEGATRWTVDETSGALVCEANASGKVSRLIVEVDAPALLQFEMAVSGGNGAGLLAFYVDGVRVADTAGAAVSVYRELTRAATALLMWESSIQTGQAVIRPTL